MGFNGYELYTLFARLLCLPHLELFSPRQSSTTAREVMDLITAAAATAFLSLAPQLREVYLLASSSPSTGRPRISLR